MKLIITLINFTVVCLTYLTILYASVGFILSLIGHPIGNDVLAYSLLVIAAIVFIISIGLLNIGFVTSKYIKDHQLLIIGGEKINAILSDICKQLNVNTPTLYYMDNMEINASVVGKDMMILNKGLVKFATRQEIYAIMAHEAGHLKHGDSRYFEYNYILNIMASEVLGFTERLIYGRPGDEREMSGLLMMLLLPLICYLFILRIAWFIVNTLTFLVDRVSSPYKEYRADRCSVKVGLGEHLISFAEKLMEKFPEERKEYRFFSTHPTWKQRIKAIRELQEKEVLPHESLAGNRS